MKEIITGSANPQFLKEAVEKLITYKTPKEITVFVKKEMCKVVIGNPPFKIRK